jgi:hypothetical protein
MKRFWSELKDEVKRTAWMYLLMLIVGYGFGKSFTYESLIYDCKVMGMFRIADVAFDCRMSKVPT